MVRRVAEGRLSAHARKCARGRWGSAEGTRLARVRRRMRTYVRALGQPDPRRGREQHRLPGYRDPASVRRFDAPEALDTRFYEVHAKSVLNRVPAASQMPFRWTMNPYRGCSHACIYCASGGTRVLLADGRNRKLEDLAGRRCDRRHSPRRSVPTIRRDRGAREVVEHQARIGGRARGWHRAGCERRSPLSERSRLEARRGRECGPMQRPHLTENNRLIGPGGCAEAPVARRRLQAWLPDRNDPRGRHHRQLRRTRGPGGHAAMCIGFGSRWRTTRRSIGRSGFLADFEVATDRFLFSAATARHREVSAVRTQRRLSVERIRELIEWPLLPSLDLDQGLPRRDLRRGGIVGRGDPHCEHRSRDHRLGLACRWVGSASTTRSSRSRARRSRTSASEAASPRRCASSWAPTRRSRGSARSPARP